MNWLYICEGGGPGNLQVYVSGYGGIKALQHYVRHSPDGFQIGYSGSGPTELARCILLDFFQKKGNTFKEADKKTDSIYQNFKWDFVAPQKESLIIKNKDIEKWLEKK